MLEIKSLVGTAQNETPNLVCDVDALIARSSLGLIMDLAMTKVPMAYFRAKDE